jgi:hypothetical protein
MLGPVNHMRIRQSSPSHYQLVLGKVVYDVNPGHNNLFDTLCLFVYDAKVNSNGYLGLMYLGAKDTDLLSVVA